MPLAFPARELVDPFQNRTPHSVDYVRSGAWAELSENYAGKSAELFVMQARELLNCDTAAPLRRIAKRGMDQWNGVIRSVVRVFGRVLEEFNRNNGSVATLITELWFCRIGSTTVLTGVRPFIPVLISIHSFHTPPVVVAFLHPTMHAINAQSLYSFQTRRDEPSC